MRMQWILAPVLLVSAAVVMAQPMGKGSGQMGGYGMNDGRMAELYEALDLTPEQKEKAAVYMKEKRMGKMAKRMGLDDAQKEQMQQLMESNHKERDALYSKYGLTSEKRQAMQQEMKAMRQSHHAAMNAILTDEQREAMGGRGMGAGKGHGMGGGHGMMYGDRAGCMKQ